MANKNWVKGGASPNPDGRRRAKYSAQTAKGKLERWFKRQTTPQNLNRIMNALDPRDQAQFLIAVAPYVLPKQSSVQVETDYERLSDDQLQDLLQNTIAGLTQQVVLPIMPVKQLPNTLNIDDYE